MGTALDHNVVESYDPYQEHLSGHFKAKGNRRRNAKSKYPYLSANPVGPTPDLKRYYLISDTPSKPSLPKFIKRWNSDLGGSDLLSSLGSLEGKARPGDLLRKLNEQAQINVPWAGEDLEALTEWSMDNRGDAFSEVQKNSNHGRLRWAILESLAHKPDDQLRQTLCQLVGDHQLDHWLLNGVPAVIRMVNMVENREQAAKAMRSHLRHIQRHAQDYRDHVAECGVGELAMTFGSFADASDFDLVGTFALGTWRLKVRVNAFDSLRRMAQRHAASKKTDAFFESRSEKLAQLGQVLAGNFRTSSDAAALFLAWLCLILSRIGPEAEWIEPILQEHPRHVSRVRYELKQARARLEGTKKLILERLERLAKLVR